MTKTEDKQRCQWCGRSFAVASGRGRPRKFCSQGCRQRQYESRLRAAEAGLTEHDLIVTRRELDALRDQLYVLEAAIEDVERDLAKASPTKRDLDEALSWILDAARPLLALRFGEGSASDTQPG